MKKKQSSQSISPTSSSENEQSNNSSDLPETKTNHSTSKKGKKCQEIIETIPYILIDNSTIQANGIDLKRQNTRLIGKKIITYFYCSGGRLINQNNMKFSCKFSGKISEYDKNLTNGFINILRQHENNCPKKPIYDFPNSLISNTSTTPFKNDTKPLDEIKEEIIEDLNKSKTPSKKMIKDFLVKKYPLDFRLTDYVINTLWKAWKKENNVSSEEFVYQNQLTTKNLPFFRLNLTFS